MEQKTEASQAVDEREQFEHWAKDTFGLTCRVIDGKYVEPTESLWVGWQARAALKAQPAPTEAQGRCPQCNGILTQSCYCTEAQGEDSARLSIPVSAYLWLMGAGDRAFMAEDESGPFWWRSKFSDLAGVDMVEVIMQDRARASAETGGVKP